MPATNTESSDIEVRVSAIHGRGVFAAQDIPAGACIGRYTGRRYSAKQAARRDWDTAETYVFGLSDGSIIDGASGGNATRYLNHCCAPNCAAVETRNARGALEVIIEAVQPIAKGQELLLDYQLTICETDDRSYACHCGAANCRGSMAAAPA